jgi:hypothetical protein
MGTFPDSTTARDFLASLEAGSTGWQGGEMARYLVERTFPDGLRIPINDDGVKSVTAVVDTNASDGVTWIHSYVSPDRQKTFCIYDGPSPEAIRRVAQRNDLPVDSISEVRVLDPYFYH